MKYVYIAAFIMGVFGILIGIVFPMLISTKSDVAVVVGGLGMLAVALAILHVSVNLIKKWTKKND